MRFTCSGEGELPIPPIRTDDATADEYLFYQFFITEVKNPLVFKVGSDSYLESAENKKMDIAPIIADGTTLVPLRVISELFDATVEWNEGEWSVNISCGDKELIFPVDETFYYSNGEEKPLDTASVINNGRVLITLRAVAEEFGKSVEWHEATQMIVIADFVNKDILTSEIMSTLDEKFAASDKGE